MNFGRGLYDRDEICRIVNHRHFVPFTFFDEVEAALDEANTKKIIKVLKEFIDRSQFILITHNKETMKGANRLYGVTMNKEIGESMIVNVDI